MRLRLPLARIVSVLLFAALCAIVAAWALALLAPRPPIAPAGAVAASQGPVDLSAAGQLFGGVPQAASVATVAAPSNIQVAGVLATEGRGVALLVVDGRPAKPFAVGEVVSDGLHVRSVSADAVELSRGGASESPMRLAAPPRGSLAVLTGGPQRGGASGFAPAQPAVALPPPAGAPLPARPPLPPAGADAGMPPAAQGAPAVDPNAAALQAGALRMPGLAPGAPPGLPSTSQ